METTIEENKTKKFILSPSAIMLIIAAIALIIGIVAPPMIRKNENKHINEDCRTASTILAATKTALKDNSIAQQVNTAGYATLTWTVAENKGVITCTNNIADLQNAVIKSVGDVPRRSKTLGTAVWTVTVYPNADKTDFTVNGAWSGAIGADDTEMTKKSGGTVAQQ